MLSKEIPESDWRILQNALRVDSYSLFFHSRNQLFSLYCPKSVVPDYLFKLYQVAETLRFETEALQQLALIGFHACPKIKIVTSHGIALQYISYGSLARSLDTDFISAESPLTNTLTAISVTEQIFEQLNILKSTATVNNEGDNYFLKHGLKAANIVNQNRERHPFTLLADKVSQYLVEFGKHDAYQTQICRVHGDLRIHNILISPDVKEIVFVDWELSHYGDCNVD